MNVHRRGRTAIVALLTVSLLSAATLHVEEADARPRKIRTTKGSGGKKKPAAKPPVRLERRVRGGVGKGLDAAAQKQRSSGGGSSRSGGGGAAVPAPSEGETTTGEEGAESTSLLQILGLAPDEPEPTDPAAAEPGEATGEAASAVGDGRDDATGAASTPSPTSTASLAGDVARAAVDGRLPGDRPTPADGRAEDLPRVARGVLEVDVLAAGAARGWVPQQYPAMDVTTTVMATWQIDVRANVADVFRIRRAYYESSGLVAPRGQVSDVAEDTADVVSRMAWLLGVVGVPIGKTFEPIVRYEARAFESTAQPTRPVRFIPYGAEGSLDLNTVPLSRRSLTMASTFETFLVALQWNHEDGGAGVTTEGSAPLTSAYLGGGYTTFGKPYMIRIGDTYLDDMVFDSRFHGGGLALGASRAHTPRSVFYDVSMQVGVGDVALTRHLDLSSTLPDDWTVGYLQGNVTAGYVHPVVEGPVSVHLGGSGSLGGNYFFFSPRSDEEGEAQGEGSGADEGVPLNWDLLWAAQASLMMTM